MCNEVTLKYIQFAFFLDQMSVFENRVLLNIEILT